MEQWAAVLLAVPVIVFVLCLLDLMGKINILQLPGKLLCLLIAPNWVVLRQLLQQFDPDWQRLALLGAKSAGVAILALGWYLWLRLSFFPVRDRQKTGARLKIMAGGRIIVPCAIWGMILECIVILAGYRHLPGLDSATLTANTVYAFVLLACLLANGVFRMLLTSRRLNLTLRVLLFFTWWIPVLNLPFLRAACRRVYEEYDFAVYKRDLREVRAESDLCKTKYPLVLVHGVFFRDLKYFNYWGRVPKELTRYGAQVYYGNQEAVGTIEANAADIKQRILEIQAETGCGKVNIIAHSKGGLDSRYMIGCLGMEDAVASLTTMNSPHHGCRFVDKVLRIMPGSLYRFIGKCVDGSFRKLGDQNPDFERAVQQFTTENSRSFNEQVPDPQKVYCQSFTTRMKNLFSDTLLTFPYILNRIFSGRNDGLVPVESAQWMQFRGVLESKSGRGISHGDIIDLKREDYRGFDVVETYVGIVKELKEMGF